MLKMLPFSVTHAATQSRILLANSPLIGPDFSVPFIFSPLRFHQCGGSEA